MAAKCPMVAALLGAALLLASPCAARPYTVDDLLQTESFGTILADPKGRWLAFERLVGIAHAPRFDMPDTVMRSRLHLARPGSGREAIPLLTGEDADIPAILYGASPNGERLAIGAWRSDTWQLGIVETGSGVVRWQDLVPAYVPGVTTVAWVSDDRLVMIAEPVGTLSWALRIGREASDVLAKRWSAMAAGGPVAVTAVGSGHWRQVDSIPPDQRLVDLDVETGAMVELARGRFARLSASPDGRRLAAIARGALLPLAPDRAVTIGTSTARHHLLIVDIARGGAWHPCTACDVREDSLVWSVDGDLALFARGEGEDWAAGRIWRVPRRTRKAVSVSMAGIRPIVSGPPSLPFHIDLAWRRDGLLVYGAQAGTPSGRGDWYRLSGSGAVPLTTALDETSATVARTSACATTMVAAGNAWCLDDERPRAIALGARDLRIDTGGNIVMRTSHAGDAWMAIDAAGTAKIAARDVCTPETWLSSSRMAILRCAEVDGSSTLLAAPSTGPATPLARINTHLAAVSPARRLAVRHEGLAGRLTSWLYLPPARDRPKAGWPLVVIPYPGRTFGDAPPAGLEPAGGWRQTNAQLLAAAGYAVLAPSMPRLAPGTGLPFDFGGQVAQAIAAIPPEAGVDTATVGLWGHSFGAYAGAVMAASDQRYQAVVLASGAYDLSAAHGGFSPATRVAPEYGRSTTSLAGWAESGQPALNGPPWSAPDRYVAASPVFTANRISAPTLIVASDRDIFAVDQAEALFSVLDRHDRDAMMRTYWGERHVISSPANVRDMMGHIIGWFDCYLKREGRVGCAGEGSLPAEAARASPAPSARPAASRKAARRDRSG